MSPPPAVERRKDRRHPCRVRLVLTRGGQELVAQTEDVSFAGIFIRTDTPIPARQLVRLRLTLPPDGDELSVMGMVARHFPARDDLPPGVGIQFYSLGAAERRRWDQFIRFVTTGKPAAPARAAAPAVPAVVPEPVRRRFPRYAACLQVRLGSVDDLKLLYTRNLSGGGLFFDTAQDLAEGTSMKVSVIHPRTHEQFQLDAVVRWRNTSSEPGLGLEFVGLTEAQRDQFLEFISSEIPVEEVVYVAEGDPHLTRVVPPG
jgi:Tfp pilus assembly protein PilZ